MYEKLISRLHRYTENLVAYKLDADFADAVQQAADAIEELTGFVQEAERDRGEYRERLDKANDAIEKLSKKYLASEVDNTNLTGWLAEEHAKNRWIPVTERLPKEGDFVLVYGDLYSNKHDGGVIAVSKRMDWNYWQGFGRERDITHWMPLPEPPKEGT